jgi:transposase
METKRPRLGPHDIAVGIDLATTGHVVAVINAEGSRVARFKIPHSVQGVEELMRRVERLTPTSGAAWFGFEGTGHVWPAVAHLLSEAGKPYRLVNPLATHRVREARQMGRDKRDITDAEQIADLLRIGMVTRTQLMPQPYVELRRRFSEFDRLRFERARLKVLLRHQLYGLFPEFVENWSKTLAPGALAVLRLGLTPAQIAGHTEPELVAKVKAAARGRRFWRHKVRQIIRKAQNTVAPPHGAEAMAREVQRIVWRIDCVRDQMHAVGAEIQEALLGIEEAEYLSTIPGISWATAAGIIAEVGPIDRYRSGRQLIKLAGTNPGRKQTGNADPNSHMTRRGRGRLRGLLYMATLSSIQHNPRMAAHFDHLTSRANRPLPKMAALGACMNKLLLYAFAVMKKRAPFDVHHKWKEDAPEAA